MKKIKVTSVSYDTDGNTKLAKTLPQSLDLSVDSDWFTSDPDDCIADAISDVTGYCVFGFTYEEV